MEMFIYFLVSGIVDVILIIVLWGKKEEPRNFRPNENLRKN